MVGSQNMWQEQHRIAKNRRHSNDGLKFRGAIISASEDYDNANLNSRTELRNMAPEGWSERVHLLDQYCARSIKIGRDLTRSCQLLREFRRGLARSDSSSCCR